MAVETSVNIAYNDIYDDYEAVNVKDLLQDIPTKMALTLVCHYTGQIHTQEKEPQFQLHAIGDWCRRFDQKTIAKIQQVINKFSGSQTSNFNFINNVSSLHLIEAILENRNDLPVQKDLTPQQEENLFKAYIYFSEKWTKEQELGALKYEDVSAAYVVLTMMLPYSELFEFKDFRMQFLKAVYFFKYCEENALFSGYLNAFLEARGIKTWKEYLFNLLSVYVTLLQPDSLKTVLRFDHNSMDVFNSLETFCVNVDTFKSSLDFLTLRETPIYKNSDNELLFLNVNFLIDKIYHSIIFDFADVLIKKGLTYNGKPIKTKPQFFGVFGEEFIEPGLFFKVMQYVFRQKGYVHYSGEKLKQLFGDGTPDYLIIDKTKIYLFEFKNAIFSGPVKYTFDMEKIQAELDKKLVKDDNGHPKGVTQLVNVIEDMTNGRYKEILNRELSEYSIFPIIVTTDYTFILPVIYSLIAPQFNKILAEKKLEKFNLNVREATLIDLDSFIKFQDLFIERKLTLNYVLNGYQEFLSKGKDSVDRSLSFHRYIHLSTLNIKYDTPKLFWTEIKANILPEEKGK